MVFSGAWTDAPRCATTSVIRAPRRAPRWLARTAPPAGSRRPAVACPPARTHDPEADHHQHQQRQDGDLVGDRPVLLRVQREDDGAEHNGPTTADSFPAIPYRPSISPTSSGLVRRRRSSPSVTATPPSPEPRMAPATRNADLVQPEADEQARPTVQLPSTEHERSLGTDAVAGDPPEEAGDDGHHDQPDQHEPRLGLREANGIDGEQAHHRDGRVDRVGVKEAADHEAQQARPLPRVRNGDAQLRPGPEGFGRAETIHAAAAARGR